MLRTLRHTLIVPLCVLGLSPHADDSHDPRLEAILGAANSIGIVCDYTYTHAGFQRPVVTEAYSSSDGWRLVKIDRVMAQGPITRSCGTAAGRLA